jgi:hypothetical protein
VSAHLARVIKRISHNFERLVQDALDSLEGCSTQHIFSKGVTLCRYPTYSSKQFMKRLSITLVLLFVLAASDRAHAQLSWDILKICDTCDPSCSVFSDDSHGFISARRKISFPLLYRVNGLSVDSLKGQGFWGAYFNHFNSPSSQILFYLDAQLWYTFDSGNTWRVASPFPFPSFVSIQDSSKGLSLVRTIVEGFNDTSYSIRRPTGNLDFWYEPHGESYPETASARDAAFWSSSHISTLHSANWSSRIWNTVDSGKNWTSTHIFDPIDSSSGAYFFPTSHPSTFYLISSGKYLLSMTTDSGKTWTKQLDVAGGKVYRIRASVDSGEAMIMWGLKGNRKGGVSFNLLQPDWPRAYADTLIRSLDSGKTWTPVDIGMQGVRYSDLFITKGHGLFVIFVKDSATYLARLKTNSSSVKPAKEHSLSLKVNPNPVKSGTSITLSGSGEGQLTISDMLGRVVLSRSMILADKTQFLLPRIAAGIYTLNVRLPHKPPTSARLIIY